MRSSGRFIGILTLLAAGLALVACGARPAEVAPTADASGLAQNMQGMMTGMQGMMQNLQGTPMSPEVMAQMQGMMTGMQGMMGNLQTMPMSPEMMQRMQGMMGNMQGMMAQMHATGTPMPMPGMGMMMGNAPQVPAGLAYSEGQEIRFIHTEASDPEIAQRLSDMMASPVLVVPSLAQVPASAVAPVYVFTNGVAGMGPLGFQPDVFPFPPGAAEYTPLRTIHLVTWADPTAAVELKSAADVRAAIAAGQLTEEVPGVVVNMPFVAWANGSR